MPVTTELRVRYAETDQMGIVYYANYFVWFELGGWSCCARWGSLIAGWRPIMAAFFRWYRPVPLPGPGALRR